MTSTQTDTESSRTATAHARNKAVLDSALLGVSAPRAKAKAPRAARKPKEEQPVKESPVNPKRMDPAMKTRAFSSIVKDRAGYESGLKAAQKRRDVFEDRVALTVSAEPTREDWYAFPGLLTRDEILAAGSLTTVGLHRLMERYRKRNPPKPKTTTRKKAK